MRVRAPLALLPLLALLTLNTWAPVAQADICAFGYTGTRSTNSGAIRTEVGATTGYLVADSNPYVSMVAEVNAIVADTGPVFINLKEVIFNPNPTFVPDCTYYERGPSTATKTFYNTRGNYKARVDAWFATNAALFGSQPKVYGLVVHDEANNDCVRNWTLYSAADYVKQKLASAGYSPIYVAAAYGLRNIPGGAVSHGLPVTPTGAIGNFPLPLDLIGYTVYDIFDPSNPNNTLNLNAESWATISGKLDQALRPHQKTVGILRGYCQPGGTEEVHWDILCPPNWKNWWKLGILSNNWTNYWKNDPRNLFVLAFHWPDAGSLKGTSNMHVLWDYHAQITPNCTINQN